MSISTSALVLHLSHIIEPAGKVSVSAPVEPALTPSTGLERLRQLSEKFLQHVESNLFPGGCFFASVAAEMDTHPGPIRDLAVQLVDDWVALLTTAVRDAQAEGAIDASEDPEQLAFELEANLLLAIEKERKAELFGEWGHRWFDLKRTPAVSGGGKTRADEVIGGMRPATWASTDVLYPIPDAQRVSNPALTQNPGYNN